MIWRIVKLVLWVVPPLLLVAAAAMLLWFRRDVVERERSLGGELHELRAAPVEKFDFGLDKFDQAVARLQAGDEEEARRLLLALLRSHRDSSRAYDAMRLLGQLNLDRLLDPNRPFAGKQRVEVGRGDSLNRIAATHRTTFHYLVRANGLARPDSLQPHDQLWVCPMDFKAVVRLGEKRVVLMDGERFFAVFPILEARRAPGSRLPAKHEVGQKFGVAGGKRLQPSDEGFPQAEKWIEIGPDWAIRSVRDGAAPVGFGLFLAEEDVDDLMAVLRKGNPVEINP